MPDCLIRKRIKPGPSLLIQFAVEPHGLLQYCQAFDLFSKDRVKNSI